jgi:hypothetical protein
MSDPDFDAWREKGRKVGRQLLATLDVMALEEVIRASGSNPEVHRNALLSHAYQSGLRDVLREYRQAARPGAK